MSRVNSSSLRSAVLDAEFGTPRRAGDMPRPLTPELLSDLVATVSAYGGAVIESTPRHFVALSADARNALSLARTLTARLGREGPAAPTYRIVLGYGHVGVGDDGLESEWMASFGRLRAMLPLDSVGVQPLFGDQLAPADRELLIPMERSRGALLVFGESGEQNLTRAAPLDAPGAESVFSSLTLIVAGKEHQIAPSDGTVYIGRDRGCEVIVPGSAVSRLHGRIDFVRDKFMYTDQSRNGSWVLTPAGEELRVHDEPIALIGEGVISPGLPIGEQTSAVVRYRCHSSRLGLDTGGSARDGVTRPL